MSELPYDIYHLDVVSPAARSDAQRMTLYAAMTSLKSSSKERAAAALGLMENGAYVHAASIDAVTAFDAIMMTTNEYQKCWILSKNKKIVPTMASSRSTSNRDIISRFGKKFLFMPMGFINLNTGEYENELV